MRLYLSSFRLGNQPTRFTQLVGENKRVAVISNSRDAFPDLQRRADSTRREIEALGQIDLVGTELDLRRSVGRSDELREILSQYGAVWILGGNVFVLRRAMRDSGFDTIIKEFLQEDRLVYAGYSAAACVLAPMLKGLDLVDPISDVTDVLRAEVIWQGLDVLPYSIIPHYKSDHPESEVIDKVVEYMQTERQSFKTLQDGEVLYVAGDYQEILK